jgi:hypothetical protein
LHHARLKESEKWQSIITDKYMLTADKDMLIAELRAQLGKDRIS